MIEPIRTFRFFTFNAVVTPKPVCIQKQESVFSVTGFLTFAVVSATAISNIIANIDNNNNNNNNNDNNDNVNNNNQISDSADATNMGNAKNLRLARSLRPDRILGHFSSSLCLPYLICQAVTDQREQPLSDSGEVAAKVKPISIEDITNYLPGFYSWCCFWSWGPLLH